MAHHSRFDSDAVNPVPPADDERAPSERYFSGEDVPDKLDLAELAEKFTVHGGGRVSAQVSTDLALDLVLNQIVEQACLATPASGAAIVLLRDGEWVCRASAGVNSPTLGARLDAEAGLSGECIKTRQIQRCDDAQSDPRADIEACRSLGVRAVLILPLLQDDTLVGVFEVFSSQPAAFGTRDESTLQVLSQRVLASLRQTSQTLPLSTSTEPVRTERAEISRTTLGGFAVESSGAENLRVENALTDNLAANANTASDTSSSVSEGATVPETVGEVAPDRAINILTWILGAAVFAFVLLLTTLMAERLFGGKTTSRAHSRAEISSKVRDVAQNPKTDPSVAGTNAAPIRTKDAGVNLSAGKRTGPEQSTGMAAASVGRPVPSPPKAGSLQVFEKGKEIFHLPPEPEREQGEGSGSGAASLEDPAAKRAAIYELPPEAVSGSLLHRVEPEYPEEALAQQIQGPVTLDVRIAPDGTVETVNSVNGQRLLADAAIAAVRQWRFKPHVSNGQAVEMQTRVILNFRLPQ